MGRGVQKLKWRRFGRYLQLSKGLVRIWLKKAVLFKAKVERNGEVRSSVLSKQRLLIIFI